MLLRKVMLHDAQTEARLSDTSLSEENGHLNATNEYLISSLK